MSGSTVRLCFWVFDAPQDAGQFKTAFEDGQKKNASLAASTDAPAAPAAEAEGKSADATTVAPAAEGESTESTTAAADAKADDAKADAPAADEAAATVDAGGE